MNTVPVDQPLFLDHGQVSFSTGTAVVVAHGSAHLLVVHLLASVGLHLAPGSGKLHGVAHLEDPVGLTHPADYPRIVRSARR